MRSHHCPGSRRHHSLLAVPLLATLAAGTAASQAGLEYRQRGNRYEGVRTLPVGGYTIELLSLRAISSQPSTPETTRDTCRLRFFLAAPAAAHVVVREVDNRHSYWLDRVQPASSWRPGFGNVFEWPAADVVARLGLGLADLGVVVRLGNENPAKLEHVAPALLYGEAPPATVTGYQFAFKTNATARLEFVVQDSNGTVTTPSPEPGRVSKWSYGIPIRVAWNASHAQSGEYRLRVEARVLQNNATFAHEVWFYHQPRVQ